MQHSQTHITLYWSIILLSWGGNMMLYSASLASFVTPYYGVNTMILCSSLTSNSNNNFGTNGDSAWPYIDNLRQSLAIGNRTTWTFWEMQLQRSLLIHSLIIYGHVSLVYWTTTYYMLWLGCFTGTYGPDYIVLFSVNPSAVDHSIFNNFLVLLLIITFASVVV